MIRSEGHGLRELRASVGGLALLKQSLPIGSTRLLIYETMMQRAQKKERLPAEAKAVMEEIKIRLKDCIRETDLQRHDRLDKEFEAL